MYDFQAAVSAAKAVVEGQESRNGATKDYTYPLVYPQPGQKLTVRPLFNPKSGQILRLIYRHEKTACYRTYGIECPICKSMQQVKDMTGQDPFGRGKSSKSRGICFAQYISSSNQIDKGGNKGVLQPGEIVLLMFPWSVYTQISSNIQTISQTPTGMDQAFCHASTGMFIDIYVSNDGNYNYTTTMNPYLQFNTGKTDDEFMKMLDSMESLYEQVLPSTITEEVDKQVKEYNNEIYRQYISPRLAQTSIQSTPQQVQSTIAQSSDQFTPQTSQLVSNNVPASSPDKPACFGHHQTNSPQCIVCPGEVECMQTSNS